MYALKEYIKKWLVFIPVIHRYRPGDYHYLLDINHTCLKQLEQAVFENGHGLHTKRQYRDIRAAMTLLQRLMADEYVQGGARLVEQGGGLFKVEGDALFHATVKTAAARKKADLRLLTNIYYKRLFHWWD